MEHLFLLQPEVAGGWGPGTVVDNQAQLRSGEAAVPEVSYLEYCFDDWSGDELLAVHGCYIVTERLARALAEANITGFRLDHVQVSTSDDWQQLRLLKRGRQPDLPPFRRLLPEGKLSFRNDRTVTSWSGHDVNWAAPTEYVKPDLDALLSKAAQAAGRETADLDGSPEEGSSRSPFSGIGRRRALAVTSRCLTILRSRKLEHCAVEELRME